MNVSIIVPSLNPDEKLEQVVIGLRNAGFNDIILVNDGSAPEYVHRFEECRTYPEVTVLTHPVNRGKGRAMKTAFAWCLENRPDITGVITVDGDNQHRCEDVLTLGAAMEEHPDRLYLGVRDFSQKDVPLRSRFGNTITRNVVRLACGLRLTDTQTGLRAIPRYMLPTLLDIDGERYEFETEMLLCAKDEGIRVSEIVIATVYIDENQTSHFDTFRDSWKIYKLIFRHIFSGKKKGK